MILKLVQSYDFFLAHAGLIFGVAFGISESLAEIPSLAANSIFQSVRNGVTFLKNKFAPKTQAPAQQ